MFHKHGFTTIHLSMTCSKYFSHLRICVKGLSLINKCLKSLTT